MIPPRTFSLAAYLAMAVTAAPMSSAIAQDPTASSTADSTTPMPPSDTIVVQGHENDRAAISHQARSFERDVQATPVSGQLARWHTPICPTVSGIDPAYADFFSARIKEIAKNAGIAVGADTCKPNLFVAFTLDGAALVSAMEKREPRTLSSEPLAERQLLRTGAQPIRWWYATLLEGGDGGQFSGAGYRAYNDSLIDTGIRASITGAVVIIDVAHATGYRLDAIASYAAFVALGHFRVGSRPTTAPSILGLFGPDPATRRALTAWDRTYLSALYATQPARRADTQRSRIAGKMAGALANRPAN